MGIWFAEMSEVDGLDFTVFGLILVVEFIYCWKVLLKGVGDV